MMFIVNLLHYSFSLPSTLFMGLILVEKLLAFSHIDPKSFSSLVSFFWEIVGCAGMVKSAGPTMSPAVELLFSFLCLLVQYWYIYDWCLCLFTGSVMPVAALRAP